MKRIMCVAMVLAALFSSATAQEITPPPPAQLAAGQPPSTLFPALIQHSRRTARIENGRLTGDGADFLRELGRNAHFVLLGEDHYNSGIAEFATAYWRDLSEAGYQYGAIEADPYIAQLLERDLRAGGADTWMRTLSARGGQDGAPFFFAAPEVAWTAEMVRTSRTPREPTLWGLDQIYTGAAPPLLRDLAAGARNADARTLARALADEIVQKDGADNGGFGRAEAARLQRLRALLTHRADARWAEMVDAMIVSHRIYQPFIVSRGEAYLANDERENLMKSLFRAHYEAAERADRDQPRVMFKFGANHMFRGATPTQVQGLGGYVTEYARLRGLHAASILAVCGPGGSVSRFRNTPLDCTEPFAQTYPFLAEFVAPDQLTVFDLRIWRLRFRRWEHLPAAIQRIIGSFDVLVVVPNGPAAEPLPGLPRAPG